MKHLTFFLGMLSYAQLFFLPGVLFLRWLNNRYNPLLFLLLAAGLSLTANYLLVYALVELGHYSTLVMRCIVAVEIVTLLIVYRQALSQKLSSLGDSGRWSRFFKALFQEHYSAYHVTVFALALITMVCFLGLWMQHIGEIFHVDDEVTSWNLWALSWAGGHFPGKHNGTGIYPQLIPINFSLIYVLMGRLPGQPYLVTFARAMMPLFSVACLLMMLNLAVKLRQPRYLLAMTLLGVMLMIMLGKYIPRGFVDIPLAAVTLLAITFLIERHEGQHALSIKETIIFAILAGGIGVTKQGGLYVTLLLPLLVYRLMNRAQLIDLNARHYYIASYAIIAAIVVPWYVHTQAAAGHLNVGNVSYLTHGIYIQEHRNTFFERVAWILKKTIFPFLTFLIFAIIDMRQHKLWRSIMWFTIPYIIMWALFFSYDPRNLALAMPLVCLAAAGGLEYFIQNHQSRASMLSVVAAKINVAMVLVVVVIGISVATVMKKVGYPALMHDQQIRLKADAGDTDPHSGAFHFYPN